MIIAYTLYTTDRILTIFVSLVLGMFAWAAGLVLCMPGTGCDQLAYTVSLLLFLVVSVLTWLLIGGRITFREAVA